MKLNHAKIILAEERYLEALRTVAEAEAEEKAKAQAEEIAEAEAEAEEKAKAEAEVVAHLEAGTAPSPEVEETKVEETTPEVPEVQEE